MRKIRIQTPTSSYIIEDDGLPSAPGTDDAETEPTGLPVEPGIGSDSRDNKKGGEAPRVLSQSFDDEEIRFDSGRFAIVDAALLDAVEHPLKKKAIIIPVKSSDVTFVVSAQFDDSVLNGFKIEPKVTHDGSMEDGAVAATQDEDVVIPQGGEAQEPKAREPEDDPKLSESLPGGTMSHDSSLERKLRMTPKQRKHMRGDNSVHTPEPESRGLPRRDNKGKNGYTEDIATFLRHNLKDVLTEEKVSKVSDRKKLAETLHVMLAMTAGGWEKKDGKLVHPLGVTIAEGKWQEKGGYLLSKEGKRPDWDFDWAYASRDLVRSLNEADDYDISGGLAAVGAGIAAGGKEKALEYAKRIVAGEDPEVVLQGQKRGGATWTAVLHEVAKLKMAQSQTQPQTQPQAQGLQQWASYFKTNEKAILTRYPHLADEISKFEKYYAAGNMTVASQVASKISAIIRGNESVDV
jgi:hypothetical protein